LSGPEVSFDQNQYRNSDSATITVVDSDSAGDGTIDALVKSTTDDTGITVTLNEDPGNLGTFTGVVTFTTGDSDDPTDLLKVEGGDTITASFTDINGFTNNGIASIHTQMAEFFNDAPTGIDVSAIMHPRVFDQNFNLDPNLVESVTVDITTNADPIGISLTLPETGPDTGIFGGDPLSNLLFLVGNDLVTTNAIMTITQEDSDANVDPNVIDTTTVSVSSTSDPAGFTLTLQETDVNSGIFSGPLELNPSVSVPPPLLNPHPPSLLANGGDIITIQHGSETYHTMVTPNPNPANGAIQVDTVIDFPGDAASDIVTLSYNPSFSATVSDAKAPGGGGGGLVRPGFVVNALAGAKVIGNFFGQGQHYLSLEQRFLML